MNGWNIFEEMLDKMGAEKLLEDLAFALSDKELEENMRFIAQMNDIELDEDEEELDEDEDEEEDYTYGDDEPSWTELMQDYYPSDENGKVFDTESGF